MNAGAVDAGLLAAVMLAAAVEFVEALTIVLAMGLSRGWRSTLIGTALALLALAAVTILAGVALVDWLPESSLQLLIGTLLLIFGLQWLRKAILRSAGLKAPHDEDAEFREQQEAARGAGHRELLGLDWFAFVVAFKGVFLEGLEVVFIVITFGLNADSVPTAAAGAGLAAAVVLIAGAIAHRPLSRVPENTLKLAVGVLLSTFGTFWAIEGLGTFAAGAESLEWPGGDVWLSVLLIAYVALAGLAVRILRRSTSAGRALPAAGE